jgi:hypothetical protein
MDELCATLGKMRKDITMVGKHHWKTQLTDLDADMAMQYEFISLRKKV